MADSYDAAVIGAGVFGTWTAWQLRASGRSVALLDAYGAANSRASSSDESRVLRMGYGADEIYTRWALRSRRLWIEMFGALGQPELFQPTGALWTGPPGDRRVEENRAAFRKWGVAFRDLTAAQLETEFPQIGFSSESVGIFEPEAGAILARRAVQRVAAQAARNGVDYFREGASAPQKGRVETSSGRSLSAGVFVYACGPWLPKIFPELLSCLIRPTRQEVFYFGTPRGDCRFAAPEMPVWLDFSDDRRPYTLPDLEDRGFKLGFDRYGEAFDPDTGDRLARGLEEARAFLGERLPALAGAPLVESRVCQYENTPSGDFLIDRHPDFENVWLVGGGSGHGFKHGPAVGEYVAKAIDGTVASEARFSLASHSRARERAVH